MGLEIDSENATASRWPGDSWKAINCIIYGFQDIHSRILSIIIATDKGFFFSGIIIAIRNNDDQC
jgi:hypothetical protein